MSLAADMDLWRALMMLDVLPPPMVREVMAVMYPAGREPFSPPAVNPIDYIAERGLMPLGGPWGTILAAIYKGRAWREFENFSKKEIERAIRRDIALEVEYSDAMIVSLHGHWVAIDEQLAHGLERGDVDTERIVLDEIKDLIRRAREKRKIPTWCTEEEP